jgi:hypothetical protein
MRQAMGGTIDIAGVRAGNHTACAIFGNPVSANSAMKFKCLPFKVSGAAKQTVTVTVPAAWME